MKGQLPDVRKLLPALHARGDAMAKQMALVLQTHAPVSKGEDGGAFRDSIRGESEATSEGVTLRGVSDSPYAEFVIKPTSAHEIVAKRSGALAFEWNGKQVFFRRVQHPGTPGNDFGPQSVPEVWDAIRPLIDEVIHEALGT